MSPESVDVVVVGGGAIGMSLAWRLRQRGASVAVLERGRLSRPESPAGPRGQATWASAGMLAPLAECQRNSPLLALALASLKLYPGFVAELSEAAGVELGLQGPGLIRLARHREELAELKENYGWQRDLGLPLCLLTPEETARREPALTPGMAGSALSPLEKHIPPRSLLQALTAAAEATGVHVLENSPAEGFQQTRRCVHAVDTPTGTIHCGEVVLASGAWSGELARSLELSIPVRPVRGQTVALRCSLLLSHTLYTHDGYLVPRTEGRVVVGATADEAGFNSSPTTEGVQRLLAFATSLVPSLAHARFESACAGLRPATPDELPVLGPAPGWENVHLSTGHYRNGILLTPISAALMADWVLERKSHPLLESVPASRFARG